ncbi:sigma-70 family RNA polymerase sigma factor [Aequorivita vladivostokensis]|uniref:RNA polymerase sigma-70 factor n=1 Tax=Aequorivita vladivostokensis TaxID=171194 RepID=A0ABR5DG50_9FLAO|nr:sigma-70 family RNA polymerase sigma factor [Aequorivita vladivostokensis]KJJ37748.1 RNA polymerase sigma-70 factor [Aequorivita vladivostokensis]MDX1784398.1 sigma-70 family RNA polymerase sigma factor [Aequorivita vladivostokensis]HAV55429.1 RNA polymerase subunit sigma-70 [Aequorivita sp.]HBL79570.1 RNA polymerase subunit sigma-70 [Aequorivita sp.]
MELLNPDQWVDNYADYLYNYTIVRVNDPIVAEDLISETFLAGLKSKDNFKGEATERTWLISILKRKIIDHYRKTNSKKGKAEVHISYKNEDSEGDWLEENAADPFDRTAEDRMENRELGLAILECLEKLPKKQAAIFKLKTIEDYDTEAICKEYDITPSNLWVIIHRARKAMAECLEKNWLN